MTASPKAKRKARSEPTPKSRVKPGTSKAAAAERRKAFVKAYLVNGHNATQAAITAGFSPKTAYSQGQRLLKDVEISGQLAEAARETGAIAGLDVGRTLREVARISQFDRRKLYRPDGTPIPVHLLDDDTAAAISHEGPHGLVPFDKNRALDMAFKHQGLYERDNAQRGESLKLVVILE
jgi:phage terminase small subunit